MDTKFKDPVLRFFISFIGLVFFFIVLKSLKQIFIPLTISYFLYFLFEPLNIYLTKKKLPYSLAIIIDFTIIIIVLFGISNIIISQFSKFSTELPIYELKLNNLISTTASNIGIKDPIFTNFNLAEILKSLNYADFAGGFFNSTLNFFSSMFFILFFFIFILNSHNRILEVIKERYLEIHLKPSSSSNNKTIQANKNSQINKSTQIEKTFKSITKQVQNYILVKFLVSLATGILVGLILLIFNVDFIIVWVVLTILLNFIPNIGSIISVILPTLMAIVQFESFAIALMMAAILGFAQNLMGNIIEPKIMGNKLGLNPLVILISLLLWGYVWGITGMFLSVPLTAIIKILLSNSNNKNLQFYGKLLGN